LLHNKYTSTVCRVRLSTILIAINDADGIVIVVVSGVFLKRAISTENVLDCFDRRHRSDIVDYFGG